MKNRGREMQDRLIRRFSTSRKDSTSVVRKLWLNQSDDTDAASHSCQLMRLLDTAS